MNKTLLDKRLKNYPWAKAINKIKFKHLPQTKVSSKVKSGCYTQEAPSLGRKRHPSICGRLFQISHRLYENASLLLLNSTAVMTSKKAAQFSCCHSCISHYLHFRSSSFEETNLLQSEPSPIRHRHTLFYSSSKLIPNVSHWNTAFGFATI